jgi:hypothetical protein
MIGRNVEVNGNPSPYSCHSLLLFAATLVSSGCERAEAIVSAPPSPRSLDVKEVVFRPHANWPNLFGPTHDNHAPAEICNGWGAAGPPIVWRRRIGRGYSSPVIWGDRMIVFGREGDQEGVGVA